MYGYPRINVFSSIYLSPLSPSSRSERVPLFLSLPQSLPLSSSPTAFRLGGQNQKPGRDVRIVARASITICEGRQGGKLRARRRGWRRKTKQKETATECEEKVDEGRPQGGRRSLPSGARRRSALRTERKGPVPSPSWVHRLDHLFALIASPHQGSRLVKRGQRRGGGA